MPRKKVATKKAKTTKATKVTKTTRVTRAKKVVSPRKQSTIENVAEYLKLGESYTSLVLGIIAVVIGTVLLLSVIHTRQIGRGTPDVTPTIAQSQSFAISPTAVVIKEPTVTQMPSPEATVQPTVETKQPEKTVKGKIYVVAAGDNLWAIAEKVYGSGYNWTDIAKANNLSAPGDIHVGDKLSIPQVTPEIATVHTADDDMSTSVQTKITGTDYRVTPGDTLWAIAVRAYGDGYQWVKIAQANKLTEPDIIHKDNILKIPRG